MCIIRSHNGSHRFALALFCYLQDFLCNKYCDIKGMTGYQIPTQLEKIRQKDLRTAVRFNPDQLRQAQAPLRNTRYPPV